MTDYPVRVFVGPTNSKAEIILDQARRMVDLMGRFTTKRGQTNSRFARVGYLRFVFPTRRIARKFQSLVSQYCAPSVTTKRYRR
ncbi:hypothetical protein AB8B21_12335 [Tardiphaga sp. 866_E4_N2_1]|uniref:hypothetical protein n=1 Tax=unclassified Tardiphaga TaxID=2631404 RepID=UPI003F216B3E